MSIKFIEKCRICNSENLTPVLSLGEQYLPGYTPKSNDPNPILKKFPLEVVRCNVEQNPTGCGLVQLRHSVNPEYMYDRYYYRSGINQTMTMNLKEIVDQAKSKVKLEPNDMVIDIGCNDGTLLKNYQLSDVRSIGFDPAKNMLEFSKESGAEIIVDYFNSNSFFSNFGNSKAKIITSIAMFYDLENPNTFVEDISKILHPEGVWILELSYLPSMLTQNAFDTIVHEHLEYYHLSVIEYLLQKFSLKVVDIFLNDVNGGSFRIFVKHKEQSIDEYAQKRIDELQSYEKQMQLNTEQPYNDFFQRCNSEKNKAMHFLKTEKQQGKMIIAYGASTKGNTLLQFYGIDNTLIEFVADRNPDKWGRTTIGTNLKIISEEQARASNPDYFLVLPWHFIKEFKQRESRFLNKGGKLLVPLPTFQIISKDRVDKI
jgi:cyclopropane fatty-acyl-phospholipid synthase-like methyltransferase